MAKRIRAHHQEEVKAKIQASQLINQLQNHALGLTANELKPTQIDAAKFLLNKILSNAPTQIEQETDLTGDVKLYGWEK